MHDLIGEIEEDARREGTFDRVSRILVGCSGGGDSTALVDVLARIAADVGFELAVAHLHHGWRGEEADLDLDVAREQAEALGIPFFSRRVDLSGVAGSREEVARAARLELFAASAAEWRADAVALGHTADDQLETVILNLARGTGRRGLGGIRPRAKVDGLLLLRPLLGCRRRDLRAYCRARGLSWNEDSSNDDISLSRNRLRRRLLGELQQIHPAAVGNVARAASRLREEEEWLDAVAADAFDAVAGGEEFPGGVALLEAEISELPRPLQRRVVRLAIERVRGDCRGISHEHVDWVVAHTGPEGPGARDLPGVRVKRETGRIRFLPLVGRRLATPTKG